MLLTLVHPFSHNDEHEDYTCNPDSRPYRNHNPGGTCLYRLTRVSECKDTGTLPPRNSSDICRS